MLMSNSSCRVQYSDATTRGACVQYSDATTRGAGVQYSEATTRGCQRAVP